MRAGQTARYLLVKDVSMPTTEGLEQYVKVLLSYDIVPELVDEYYQFALGKFVPAAQRMGLGMAEAWHTAYGSYPIRLIAFVAEDRATVDQVLSQPEWIKMEEKLQEFVYNYQRRIVPLKDRFQF